MNKRLFLLMGVCLVLSAGCSKAPLAGPVALQDSSKSGGAQAGQGKGDGDSGRNSVLQVPFDNAAKLVMANVGKAYQLAMAADGKAPKNADEAGLDSRNLKTKRDMQDREIEVVYGVDVRKLGEDAVNYAIAWEKTPDNGGWRMVLMADLMTVKFVAQAEFDRMKKASK